MWVPKVLSIAGTQPSLEDFLTFLQIAHVPASRSRTQLGPELETKHIFPRVSMLVQGSQLDSERKPGVTLQSSKRPRSSAGSGSLPLPPGTVRRAPPTPLSPSAACPPALPPPLRAPYSSYPLPKPPSHSSREHTPSLPRVFTSRPAVSLSREQSFPPATSSRESAPRGRGSFRISQAPPTPATRAR